MKQALLGVLFLAVTILAGIGFWRDWQDAHWYYASGGLPYVEPGRFVSHPDGIFAEITRLNRSVSARIEVSATQSPNWILGRMDSACVFTKIKYLSPHEDVVYIEHFDFGHALDAFEGRAETAKITTINNFMEVFGIPRWRFFKTAAAAFDYIQRQQGDEYDGNRHPGH